MLFSVAPLPIILMIPIFLKHAIKMGHFMNNGLAFRVLNQ